MNRTQGVPMRFLGESHGVLISPVTYKELKAVRKDPSFARRKVVEVCQRTGSIRETARFCFPKHRACPIPPETFPSGNVSGKKKKLSSPLLVLPDALPAELLNLWRQKCWNTRLPILPGG